MTGTSQMLENRSVSSALRGSGMTALL